MNLTAALSVLQSLLLSEGGGTESGNQLDVISDVDVAILGAEELSAHAALFWQASTDANISINSLSR